jgi:outer membrane lipoprotein SlyB
MTSPARAHPILIIAALSVVIFSLTGVAAMMGWLPKSQSEPAAAAPDTAVESASDKKIATAKTHLAKPKPVTVAANEPPKESKPAQKSCPNCGVVESVKVVELEGEGSGLGAVAGGVVGGLVGNQIGKGRGNTVATVAGAAGGAYAGHQVEKNMKKTKRFDIVVRMDDGMQRSFRQDTDPGLAAGQKVRIENGNIIAQ